jgi:hypothetical protein
LMKKKTSALTEPDASAPFRASLFPSCLLHAEADLKPKKDFKKATLWTNVAGACGLALVWCGEMAYSALGKDSDIMKRLRGAISGDAPQDVESLLTALRDTQEDLADIRKGLGKIANVGSSIAAGSFNQDVDDLRHLVWDSSAAKAIRPTLELCPPSLTHLFGDDPRIKEALEAAKHKPYQAAHFPLQVLLQPPYLWFLGGKELEEDNALHFTRRTIDPSTVLSPREKPTALPPRRGRARRRVL